MFAKANDRVNKSETPRKFASIIFADWHNEDEHLEWVATADESEIAEWAQEIADDEADEREERSR